MRFEHSIFLRRIKNVAIPQPVRIGKLLDAAIVWLPVELENCGVVESILNECTEEWKNEGMILLDWTEEVFYWIELFVAFTISKNLIKGKADKPSIAPVTPVYFKKSRREILFLSVLDSFLEEVLSIWWNILCLIIKDSPM